jgi:ribonuclease HI
MKKQKFYTVWVGRTTGVFDDWQACKAQVDGYVGARYKAFETRMQAQIALKNNPNIYTKKAEATLTAHHSAHSATPPPTHACICVDAACNGANGDMEYQGVYYPQKKLLFHQGIFKDGTNNIGEFLAIVHALAYLQKHQQPLLPVYSDSKTAMGWVQKKTANTKLAPTAHNQPIFDLIARAELWLHDNAYTNPVLKWKTELWGENPADFGRK